MVLRGRMYWQFIILLSYRHWLLFYTDNVCSSFLLLVCMFCFASYLYFFFTIKKWKHTLKKIINKIIINKIIINKIINKNNCALYPGKKFFNQNLIIILDSLKWAQAFQLWMVLKLLYNSIVGLIQPELLYFLRKTQGQSCSNFVLDKPLLQDRLSWSGRLGCSQPTYCPVALFILCT